MGGEAGTKRGVAGPPIGSVGDFARARRRMEEECAGARPRTSSVGDFARARRPTEEECAASGPRIGGSNLLDEAARLVARLRSAGQTLSLAESCTGGLIGAAVTAIAGASGVFWGGVASYDDDAKRALLGVSEESLRIHGAVSRVVVLEMAARTRRLARTTWSAAVTGIAGPGGGTAEKPVGTVWIAVDGPSRGASRYRFAGGRDEIREAAAAEAMRWLASACSHVDESQECANA